MAKASTIVVPVNADSEVTSLLPTSISGHWAYLDLVSLTIELSSGNIDAGDWIAALIYPQIPKKKHALLASTDEAASTSLTLGSGKLTGVISLATTPIKNAILNAEGSFVDVWLVIWDDMEERLRDAAHRLDVPEH